MKKRSLEQVCENLRARGRRNTNPASFVPFDVLDAAIGRLQSYERDHWADVFSQAADPFEASAAAHLAADRNAEAARDLIIAYDLCHVGRYPAANSPRKKAAYRRGRAFHHRALQLSAPDYERIEIPFTGRAGEGDIVSALLRKREGKFKGPAATQPGPLLIAWGGIDSFKEERALLSDDFRRAGFSVLCIDMPGTGECPIAGSLDAERLWDPIFAWAANRPDVDARNICVLGMSTGGYWAAKLAHTHRDHIRAAINQGGCTHFAFEKDWIDDLWRGEYPFELPETLASAWGLETEAQWRDYAPRLSLLRQDILDRPSAPLLLVNGIRDTTFPIADMYLLLRHGDPKTARFYDSGHMGQTPKTTPMMVAWLAEQIVA